MNQVVDFTVPFLKMSFFPVCSTPSFLQSNSAESVAMGLLRQFEGMQLPAASELDWLVPEQDAPQKVHIPAACSFPNMALNIVLN